MRIQSTRGTALLICLFALLLLTLLGGLALSMAQMEMRAASYQQHEIAALYQAEAGIHLMLYWLGHPESAPLAVQNLFMPRFVQGEGSLAFINEEGASQFSGNPVAMDIPLGVSQNKGPWDSTWIALWRILGLTGETLTLKLYGPTLPGAVGILESTARTSGGVQKTLRVQLAQKGPRLRPMNGTWHERYE